MRQKRNNKGFSLVELIVVIAIMIVLVAVLAPVFTKYVEQSRRATDVQNANSIAEAILTDATDGTTKVTSAVTELTGGDTGNLPSSIKALPEVKGNAYSGAKFYVSYDETTNEAHVFVGNDSAKSGDLTKEKAAQDYKDAKKAGAATDDQDNGGN